jgi:glycosyltransferase involved in cell wall biosynthesis
VYPGDRYDNDLSTIRIPLQNVAAYAFAADAINLSNFDVISLQHEFGIFGGTDGEFVLDLVSRLQIPVVTTFHTVYAKMPPSKRQILGSLAKISKHLVVLTDASKKIMIDLFDLPESKISVIHHGIPDIRFIAPEESALRKHLGRGPVFVSAGHIKPKKGHDVALAALARLRRIHPDLKYLIVGAPQPQFDREGSYESFLAEAIAQAGMQENVIRVNEYLCFEEFVQTIQAADIGLVTYRTALQNSSGILPLMVACGRPVVATDFEYAKTVANQAMGVFLVGVDNSEALFETLRDLTDDIERIRSLMMPAYFSARSWSWQQAARDYLAAFTKVRRDRVPDSS